MVGVGAGFPGLTVTQVHGGSIPLTHPIAEWCNGSAADSDSANRGSIPCSATNVLEKGRHG